MKVTSVQDIQGTDREVQGEGFTSLRLILAKDNMGFSFHKTIIPKGPKQRWHYKHHLEACFCVSGEGILTDLTTNKYYVIRPDTIYLLDNHDNHTFEAVEDCVLISIFNPPVTGSEIHLADGSYSPSNL